MGVPGPRALRAKAAAAVSKLARRGQQPQPEIVELPSWREVADWMPDRVCAANFQALTDVLDAAGVTWWVVGGLAPLRYTVAVAQSDRATALTAIAAATDSGLWARAIDAEPALPATRVETLTGPVLQLGVPTRCRGVEFGLDFGCDLEFWKHDGRRWLGPRENRASKELSDADMELTRIELAGRAAATPQVFTRRMVDDIPFEIDVVYTWVDGDDPAWRERRDRALAERAGVAFHPEATDRARYQSRDELRYSMRSLAMFAPWVRRVFLVTAGQTPSWLNLDCPKLELVDHRQIFDTAANLPTFNSNAISSRLHHIEGLGEHWINFNDDVLLARPARPSDFFTPSGLARVFPSAVRRGFGEVSEAEPPHINLLRNVRRLIEQETGVTVSRVPRHTPHPQLTSVHLELERRFPAEYEATWANRFRHHTDIVAGYMFHYYAQITGRAVADEDYVEEYLSLRSENAVRRMERFIERRDKPAFCLNDAPTKREAPVPDEFLREWLEKYFPIPSEFERRS